MEKTKDNNKINKNKKKKNSSYKINNDRFNKNKNRVSGKGKVLLLASYDGGVNWEMVEVISAQSARSAR